MRSNESSSITNSNLSSSINLNQESLMNIKENLFSNNDSISDLIDINDNNNSNNKSQNKNIDNSENINNKNKNISNYFIFNFNEQNKLKIAEEENNLISREIKVNENKESEKESEKLTQNNNLIFRQFIRNSILNKKKIFKITKPKETDNLNNDNQHKIKRRLSLIDEKCDFKTKDYFTFLNRMKNSKSFSFLENSKHIVEIIKRYNFPLFSRRKNKVNEYLDENNLDFITSLLIIIEDLLFDLNKSKNNLNNFAEIQIEGNENEKDKNESMSYLNKKRLRSSDNVNRELKLQESSSNNSIDNEIIHFNNNLKNLSSFITNLSKEESSNYQFGKEELSIFSFNPNRKEVSENKNEIELTDQMRELNNIISNIFFNIRFI